MDYAQIVSTKPAGGLVDVTFERDGKQWHGHFTKRRLEIEVIKRVLVSMGALQVTVERLCELVIEEHEESESLAE